VIIGLVGGGIVIAQSMSRAPQVQSVLSEVDKYTKVVKLFQEKYQYLPGDMPTATSCWATDPGGCPDPVTGLPATPYTPTPHVETCNGNGDGRIGQVSISPVSDYEEFRAWQQLADSGLIEGQYSGIAGTATAEQALIGINVPASRVGGAGLSLEYILKPNEGAPWLGVAYWWPGTYGHIIDFGAASISDTYNPALTPGEVLLTDTKVDDGLPAAGKVMTQRVEALPNCTTSDDPAVSRYNTAYSDIACSLIFITGF
jgi:hypothetical protein